MKIFHLNAEFIPSMATSPEVALMPTLDHQHLMFQLMVSNNLLKKTLATKTMPHPSKGTQQPTKPPSHNHPTLNHNNFQCLQMDADPKENPGSSNTTASPKEATPLQIAICSPIFNC